MNNEKEPAYILERHPYKPNETRITIWVKEDQMKLSSSKLAQLLANILSSQIKENKP